MKLKTMQNLITAMTIMAAGITLAPEKIWAIESPIGLPQSLYGMEIAAVFLQPIEMDPPDMMAKREESDIHLEADIHAIEGNPNGFAEGDWVPHLEIHYEITNLDTQQKVSGHFMAMAANDGAHYGDNVKMPGGIGSYKLVYKIAPPSGKWFGRHVDRETGVRPWFKPFEVEWTFKYRGVGKRGGY